MASVMGRRRETLGLGQLTKSYLRHPRAGHGQASDVALCRPSLGDSAAPGARRSNDRISKKLISAAAATSHTVVGRDARPSQKATGSSRSIPPAWLIWVAAPVGSLVVRLLRSVVPSHWQDSAGLSFASANCTIIQWDCFRSCPSYLGTEAWVLSPLACQHLWHYSHTQCRTMACASNSSLIRVPPMLYPQGVRNVLRFFCKIRPLDQPAVPWPRSWLGGGKRVGSWSADQALPAAPQGRTWAGVRCGALPARALEITRRRVRAGAMSYA